MGRKGFAAIAVAFVMVWAVAAPVLGAANPFRDVPQDHWAYDAVESLRRVNLVEGFPDGTFRGERTFTRYEMAMVFARTLARLERLIDERIEAQLADTRAAIDHLRDQLLRHVAAEEIVDPGSPTGLSPEAEAALERLVREHMAAALEDPEVAQQVITRVRELHPDLDEAAARERVQEAAEGVVASETRQLGSVIAGLADEFRDELEALGVRVDNLERLFSDLERRVAAAERDAREARSTAERVERDFAAYRAAPATIFRGSVGVDVEVRSFEGSPEAQEYGVDYYLLDPRDDSADPNDPDFSPGDRDDDVKLFDRSRITQRFNLETETELGDGLELRGSMSLANYSLFRLRDSSMSSMVEDRDGLVLDNLDYTLTGEQGTASLYYGLLDEDRIGNSFNRYTLDPDRFIEEDPVREDHRGSAIHAAHGRWQGTVVTIDRRFEWPLRDDDHFDTDSGARQAFSASAGLGENWTVTGNLVQHQARFSGNTDRLISAELAGSVYNVNVGVIAAQDRGRQDDEEPMAYDLTLGTQLGPVDLTLNYARVEEGFGRVDTAPNIHRRSFMGDGLLFQDGDAYTLDARTQWGALDLRGRYYKGLYYNDSDDDPMNWLDEEASLFRFDAGADFEFILPMRFDAAVARDSESDRDLSWFRLGWEQYPLVSDRLYWDFSYEIINNFEIDEDDLEDDWNRPGVWEEADKNVLDTTLTWRVFDPLSIYGGYKTEKENGDTTHTHTAGIEYVLGLGRTAGLTLGYEWQQHTDVSDRNTIWLGLNKQLGAGSLLIEAKQIKGAGEDGPDHENATDRIATVKLNYPVAERFNLGIGGRYIDAKDHSFPDYKATELLANLSFNF